MRDELLPKMYADRNKVDFYEGAAKVYHIPIDPSNYRVKAATFPTYDSAIDEWLLRHVRKCATLDRDKLLAEVKRIAAVESLRGKKPESIVGIDPLQCSFQSEKESGTDEHTQ
ncbi:MAG: hypothetical protein NXI04_21375 [Planctomycetaceae bacterium]|nr:hypothetical protein [Planctomycetaceae bacterium]